VSVLRSGIKIALSVLFSLVFFLIFNINIAGTAEVLTRDRLDCLYPAHLRYDLFMTAGLRMKISFTLKASRTPRRYAL